VERTTYIFADPKKAIELFVQRIFEERVKPAVDRCYLLDILEMA